MSDYEDAYAYQTNSDHARAMMMQEHMFQQIFDEISDIEDDDPYNPILKQRDYDEIQNVNQFESYLYSFKKSAVIQFNTNRDFSDKSKSNYRGGSDKSNEQNSSNSIN